MVSPNSSSSSVPLTCRRWSGKLTHTYPDWSTYPKSFLTEVEQEFVEWLLAIRVGDTFLLRSRFEVAEKAQTLWRGLLGDLSLPSLARNFHSGKIYLNRMYRVDKRKIGLLLVICSFIIVKVFCVNRIKMNSTT
jgi:hypothetical protein